MERVWLSFPLELPATVGHTHRDVPAVLRSVAGDLRTADPEGRWHFERSNGDAGDRVDIRVHTTPSVGDLLGYRLRREAGRHGWTVASPSPLRPFPHSPTGPVAADLAAASSEFAAGLLSLALDTRDHLPVAALHLRLVTGILPPEAGGAVLFHGWHLWSRALSPGHRRALVDQADQAGQLADLRSPADWRPDGIAIWDGYRETLVEVLDRHADATADIRPYLLFDHAHRTHNRLGIPTATQAVAARAVRAASTMPGVSDLATVPVRRGAKLPVPQPA